jgi:hypothetical protein
MDDDKLIEMLKDRLEECCDCIEAGYDIIRRAGCLTTDSELTVKHARLFVEEAKSYLSEMEHKSCNTPQ